MSKAKGYIEELVLSIVNHDYSKMTFSTRLRDMLGKRPENVAEYIKVGREFWHFDEGIWRKLKVTYIRSGVMFFEFCDEPNVEHAWFISSFNASSLHAAQIYPYDIERMLSEEYPDNDFAEVCKQCKWNTYNGKINVEVIWNKENE